MMLTFICKYTDCDKNETDTFKFKIDSNQNPLLEAKELLEERNINYKNIILKIDMEGGTA